MKHNILLLSLLLLLLFLTSCPKEPIWYLLKVHNKTNQGNLKIFFSGYNPGDSLLPMNVDDFEGGLKPFDQNEIVTYRLCIGEKRGVRNCIESQPEKKIYVFVFDADTLNAYDYSIIRNKNRYKVRIEIPHTTATNDADLKIEYL